MPRIEFDPKISTGHILHLVAIIFGVAAAYWQLRADLATSQTRFSAQVELAETRANGRIDANAARISAQSELIAAQLAAINSNLSDLRAELKGRATR